jgi:hypothetical protein
LTLLFFFAGVIPCERYGLTDSSFFFSHLLRSSVTREHNGRKAAMGHGERQAHGARSRILRLRRAEQKSTPPHNAPRQSRQTMTKHRDRNTPVTASMDRHCEQRNSIWNESHVRCREEPLIESEDSER